MANVGKKTSGRYRLVCVNKKTNKEIAIFCNPLSGEILPPKKEKPTGMDLTILDIYFLENFQAEIVLRLHLKNLGYSITEDDNIYIAYQHNGETKYLELIYQNMELHDLAVLCAQYKTRFSNYAS